MDKETKPMTREERRGGPSGPEVGDEEEADQAYEIVFVTGDDADAQAGDESPGPATPSE